MSDNKYIFIREDGQGSSTPIDGGLPMDVDSELEPLVTLNDFLQRKTKEAQAEEAAPADEKDEPQGRAPAHNNDKNKKANAVRGPRGGYRTYTDEQIEKLIDLVIEQHATAAEAARITGINERTAQRLVKEWKDRGSNELPVRSQTAKRRGPKNKLTEEHSQFLIDYIDENPLAVLEETMDALCARFEGLKISKASLHRHMVSECSLSFKRARKLVDKRNALEIRQARKEWVEHWMNTDLDFFTNCVFIDEAGFHTHMIRNMAWSRKGEPANVTVPTQRGNSITIVGAIHARGVVNMTLRKPKASKKRKLPGSTVRKTTGTNADHYQEFVKSVIDILDKAGLKGMYLVMDNASIHRSKGLQELVEARGHKCCYLPPYSPFLNPIEECWSKMKATFRRQRLTEKDNLSNRIQEAAHSVTTQDIYGWIKHATEFFPLCLEMIENL